MKVYQVGGAVRDKLLGRPPKDKDFLVVGATSEKLISLGYIPVGKSYDVFLHPVTKDEYTLSEDLSQDLSRRDLTINAMAMEGDELIDPFGGGEDLKIKTLRSVRDENFYHDPVRVYRLARFYAELVDFEVSTDTIKLVQAVATENGLKDIHPERILRELVKVFKSQMPSRFFVFLREQKLLSFHFPELTYLSEELFLQTMKLLDKLALDSEPAFIYAGLFIHTPPHSADNLSDRLLVSNQWKTGAQAIEQFFKVVLRKLLAKDIVDLFYKLDAFRNPYGLKVLVRILKAADQVDSGLLLTQCYEITNSISAAMVSENISGKELGVAIKEFRIRQLEEKLEQVARGHLP